VNKNTKSVQNPSRDRMSILKVGERETRSTKLYAAFFVLTMILEIFSFHTAISSLTKDVIIESTGRIGLAANVTANSGSAEDIQAAVDEVAAAGGGVVYIPEGEFNFVEVGEPWQTVNIPAGISLFGALTQRTGGQPEPDYGMSPNDQVVSWRTVLKMPYDVPGAWIPDPPVWFRIVGAGNPGESTRISDIKLVGYRSIDPESVTLHRGFSIDNVRDFRIDHCCLEHICGGAITVWGLHACGVIDHCRIFNIHGFDDLAWGYDSTFGYGTQVNREYSGITFDTTMSVLGQYTDYTVFIEDNYYSRWRHCVSSCDGAHYVFRHNNIEGDMGHFSLDAHGLREPEPHGGTRCSEIYENKIIDCVPDPEHPPSGLIIQNGGGCGVWFNNYIDSSYNSDGITLYPEDYYASETWHLKDYYMWSKLGAWIPAWDGIPSGFTVDRNVLTDWTRLAGDRSNPNYPNVDPTWSIAGYYPYLYPHPLASEG